MTVFERFHCSLVDVYLLCVGLQSDRVEVVTVTGMTNILVPSTMCRPQMFMCAHVLPAEGATFNETNARNNYKCKDLTGFVQCSAGEVLR